MNMKKDVSALSMLVFGVLVVGMGMTGLMAPQFLLTVLGFSSSNTTQIFVMASSQASIAMGLYYILAAVHNVREFFRWSVPLRILNFCIFTGMVVFGIAPVNWLWVASLELTGALATGIALARQKQEVDFDRFNALRIASVILSLVGAILIYEHTGIYGSASAFLVIFSTGFIYAYQKFPPSQELEQEK
jgi:O-antigen/teichoic acid export membrane protein